MGVSNADSRKWNEHSTRNEGTTKVLNLPTSGAQYNDVSYTPRPVLRQIRKLLGVKEYWCGRRSFHTTASVQAGSSHHGHSKKSEPIPESASAKSLYERFRAGLMEDHHKVGPRRSDAHLSTNPSTSTCAKKQIGSRCFGRKKQRCGA